MRAILAAVVMAGMLAGCIVVPHHHGYRDRYYGPAMYDRPGPPPHYYYGGPRFHRW